MKKRNVYWGIIFLLIAVFILISKLGYFPGINVFKLILSAGLIAILIGSIPKREFGGILFPLAFLCILFDDALHIQNLTPWPVLGIAFFGSIGLSFLFPKKEHGQQFNGKQAAFSDTVTNEYGNTIQCSVTFNSSLKYINSNQFESGNFTSSFGSLKVYFDQAKLKNNCAYINVEVSFGTIILYVPKEWNVQINVNTAFGSVDEKGPKIPAPDGPVLSINGDISFGSVEINYI